MAAPQIFDDWRTWKDKNIEPCAQCKIHLKNEAQKAVTTAYVVEAELQHYIQTGGDFLPDSPIDNEAALVLHYLETCAANLQVLLAPLIGTGRIELQLATKFFSTRNILLEIPRPPLRDFSTGQVDTTTVSTNLLFFSEPRQQWVKAVVDQCRARPSNPTDPGCAVCRPGVVLMDQT